MRGRPSFPRQSLEPVEYVQQDAVLVVLVALIALLVRVVFVVHKVPVIGPE